MGDDHGNGIFFIIGFILGMIVHSIAVWAYFHLRIV